MIMKSPFNWVGNKYKFIDQINKIVENKFYNMTVDLFMGSGNVLLNLSSQSNMYIGNDKQRLIPFVFEKVKEQTLEFSIDEANAILMKWDRFSSNENYYLFRDHWNKKYLQNLIDREFILETALLLKMCSNSMVRFNSDGVFNQGFRGLGKDTEFFKESMLQSVVSQLNELLYYIKEKKFKFTNKDFKEYKDLDTQNRLLIIDPPYALGDGGMYNKDFTKEDQDRLLYLIENTKNDFIYFNYLEHGSLIYTPLLDVINKKGFVVQEIGDNNVSAGQGKVKGKKWVKEVMVTNVQV